MKKKLVFILILVLIFGGAFKLYTEADRYKELPMDNEVLAPRVEFEVVKEVEPVVEPIIEEPEIEIPTKTNVRMLAVGDIMFHYPQFNAAKITEDNYDFNSVFKHVKSYIQDADLALANFETVTAGKEKGYKGYPRFNSPKQVIPAIKDAGFDLLATANNHSLDQGKKGITETIDTIEEYGLKNIGTYKVSGRPTLIEDIKGIKIGLLSYTYGVNGLESLISSNELNFMINRIDENLIQQGIIQAKENGAEVVVVFIHWGFEYHRKESKQQVELSHKMVEWGVNIILGSHPHVIQRAEIIEFEGRDNYVIYSMGNFLSNQRLETMGNSYTEDGIMVQIDLEKDLLNSNIIIKDVSYIPTWVYRYTNNKKFNYEILPLDNIDNLQVSFPESVHSRIKKSYLDTMNTINTSNSLE